MINDTLSAATRIIPATDWHHHHPWPPIGGMRHLIFKSKARPNAPGNGLEDAGAIVRVGRRVLIDEGKFFAWVSKQNPTTAKA